MKKRLSITRRDFLNGMAIGVGAGATLSPMQLLAGQGGAYYPPQLTGLRGSHVGSFEVAHSMAWEGKQWPVPSVQTDETYDLVVVGGGISGLTAAMVFQQQAGSNARILILDNHDDFGGHAKRNEFDVDGHKLIGYGGSQSLEAPGNYSAVSQKVLRDLGIDTQRFYDFYNQGFVKKWGLKHSLFFSRENFGVDRLTPNPFGDDGLNAKDLDNIVRQFPVSSEAQQALLNYLSQDKRLVPESWGTKKTIDTLRRISFTHFLRDYAAFPADAIIVVRELSKGYWGLDWGSLSTLEAVRLGFLAADRIGLSMADLDEDEEEEEPYIFHFPDGNAGVARALVRNLIPAALGGTTMEALVQNHVDYSQLDRRDSNIRLRLNSTAVRVEHTADKRSVNVTYVSDNKTYRVNARHTVLACYNKMIPGICPDVKPEQARALDWAEKTPLVYSSIAIRNWRAFFKLGIYGFHVPGAKMIHSMVLDFPVSVGSYKYSPNPDSPIVVHATICAANSSDGGDAREQMRKGMQRLYQTSFNDYEQDIVTQMNGALGPGGFDAQRDIAAITVNRWPHGYAYEYNELFDPADWSPEKGPHIAARAQIGRISIANSDASAYAYVNGAIDAAHRAVMEQIKIS